jgi:hypothetical protein
MVEVAVAPALVVAVLTQVTELVAVAATEVVEVETEEQPTQEQILQKWVMQEHARQKKEAASLSRSPSKEIDKVPREPEEIPELKVGDTTEEWNNDMFMLAALTHFERLLSCGY